MPPYPPLFEWLNGKLAAVKLNFGNYDFLFTDRAVCQLVPVLAEGGGRLDAAVPADRLPDGICHRALQPNLAQCAADVDCAAVLDFVPAACLRLDRACCKNNGVINNVL